MTARRGPRGKGLVLSALAVATATPVVGAPVGALTRRGYVPERIWSRLPVRRTFWVDLPGGAGFRYASTTGDFVGRGVYWRGIDGYEGETTRVFSRLARRARVVLDVGAHTGFFTLLACAANPAARVIAFEPVPRIFARLNVQIALNGWTDRCQTRCAAVSDRSGAVTMHVPTGELPYSASLDPAGVYGLDGTLIEAPVATVDESCAGIAGIDLVKIDVEGFEDRVLAGMQRVLAESAPAVIFEVVPGSPAAAIARLLMPRGYCFYHLRHDGPVRVDAIAPDPAGRDRNFLATTHETWEGSDE